MFQWHSGSVGQQGSEALGTGSNPSFYLHFSNFSNTTENRDTPCPLMHKNFRYQKFSETQKGSSTKFFGTVRQEISTENRDTPLFCIK